MKKLIVASSNKGKLKEIAEIFKDYYEIVSMKEMGYTQEIEENGNTFFENSLIKAKTVSDYFKEDCLADDSGLMVDYLDGAPGIYSARFSGENATDESNRKLLLEKLKGVENRKAHFVSSVVLHTKDGKIIQGYGETNGEILQSEDGENGFGYDSLFYSYDLKKSFGVASSQEKNTVSHRYRALCDLKSKLDKENI